MAWAAASVICLLLERAGGRFCGFGMASGSFADVTQEQADANEVY